jgi:hypothetical protein
MGQAIVYCWKCQNKILSTDFAERKAFQSGGRTTCAGCAGDLVRALEGSERQELISQISHAAGSPPAPPPTPVVKKTARAVARLESQKTPVLHSVVPKPGAERPRSPWAAVAAGVIAVAAVAWVIGSGGRDRAVAPPATVDRPLPAAESEAQRRQKAADQAILKARGAATSGADLDARARLWAEAVAASDGTPRRAEALREQEALLELRRESYAKELSQLDAAMEGLATQKEYRKAADFLKSARGRHDAGEWVAQVDRRLAGILEKEKADIAFHAGLVLWLRADAGVTLEGPRVSHWADQSDRHRDAIQKSPAARPVLNANGPNGKPCLAFDGAATSMSFDLPVNGLDGVTIFLVSACSAEKKGASGSDSSALYWDAGGPDGKMYLAPVQTGIRFKLGTGRPNEDFAIPRPSSIESRATLSVMVKDGGVHSLYVDGSLMKQQAGMGPKIGSCADRGILGIGKNNSHFSGTIAEVLVYDRALPDAERARVERTLAEKYGLPVR